MAEEKILEEEVLDEEDLEQVAGGYSDEIRKDANKLRDLGFLHGRATKEEIQEALGKISRQTGVKFGFELNENDENHYHINHKHVGRDRFWKEVNEALGNSRRY